MRPQGDDALVDWRGMANLVGFSLRSVRRHWFLFTVAFAVTAAGAVALWRALPQTYRVRTVVLSAPNPLMPAMVNPKRFSSRELAPSAQAAADALKSRVELRRLVEEERLLESWEQVRGPLSRVKGTVLGALLGPPTREEQLEALVGLLERDVGLSVREGTAEISVAWREPRAAAAIATWLQQRFLELRRAEEVAAIEASLGILESEWGHAAVRVEEAIGRVEVERSRKRRGAKSATVGGLQADGRWRQTPDAELMRLRTQILARRGALTELEGRKHRRLAELTAEVTELRTQYGASHPALAEAEERLAALRGQSVAIEALREEEESLVARFVALGGKATDLSEVQVNVWPRELEEQAPALDAARARLAAELARLADLGERAETARLELATAQAAFGARSGVVAAPVPPVRPDGASPARALALALLAALAVAFASATLWDVLGGRLLERWQVERAVGAPILGEVEKR